MNKTICLAALAAGTALACTSASTAASAAQAGAADAAPIAHDPAAMKAERYDKPSDEVLKAKLSSLQYRVTQEEGTERRGTHPFNGNKTPGIYVDIVSGEPLFASLHKFDSGTGWPSFHTPLVDANVVEKRDSKYGMVRVEVRSKHGDSHLGHVFEDGPKPTGLRYCINGAALRFVPVTKLEEAGYGRFASMFEGAEKKN